MAYTYVFYAFSAEFNVLFIVCVPLASLSVLGVFLVFHDHAAFGLKNSKGSIFGASSLYVIAICLILALL